MSSFTCQNFTSIIQKNPIKSNKSLLFIWTFYLLPLFIFAIKLQGLNFRGDGGIHARNLENPSKRIAKAGDSRSEKFSVFREFLVLRNEILCFRKIHRFSWHAGQFLNARSNLLLPIACDSFQILSAIECSSIQKFWT